MEKGQETIVVEGITRRYGAIEALRGVNFCVRRGEVVGFLGPNGAGKTTTMKILTGYLAATSGRATVAGFDVHDQSMEVRRRVGYLPENVPLYEEMLVTDYLHFVSKIREVPRKDRAQRVDEVAAQVGIAHMISRPIRELSKGYRQRVGLAQAIIHRPEVIILDEPTGGLDPNQLVEIREVISEIGREKTVLLSTHILQEVSAVCDRIIIIDRGVVVAQGTVGELREQAGVSTLEEIFFAFTATNEEVDDAGEQEVDADEEQVIEAADEQEVTHE